LSEPWDSWFGSFDGRLVAFLLAEDSAAAGALDRETNFAFRQPLYALRNVDTSPDARVLGFTLWWPC